ncbi:MAG: hypothetical protein FJZ00_09360 [Candidatus Sericytochromatia bacterium]|uniref:Uncharacterized protein n=1 Tax=Candidatus Tanganyikabacteria bacterium TaxID=2961651 RepID=A0A937X3P2_9BACT|nr:hypothetical protein [Candidatus Tanganyikabacteria bacterium]
MGGRVTIGNSVHALTGTLATAAAHKAPAPKVPSPSAKTTLLRPVPTTFLPEPDRKPSSKFEQFVVAFNPFKPVIKLASLASRALNKVFGRVLHPPGK